MNRTSFKLDRIVSGGQTGADRAALDAAIAQGFPYGGIIPSGRLSEDGVIPDAYDKLKESASSDYVVRTEENVMQSDGTLIVTKGKPIGGTGLTVFFADKHQKPCFLVDYLVGLRKENVGRVGEWIKDNGIRTLNVAGPRASKDPDIYNEVYQLIYDLLEMMK